MTTTLFQSLSARHLSLALAWVVVAGAAQAQTDVSVSVGGTIRPGVYGRVEIGSRPPPPIIYPQPVVITQPPVVVATPAPIYLHVPPGHAKKWRKHCYKYNACNQPVYFVQNNYSEYYEHEGKGKHKGKHKGRDKYED